MELTLTKKPWWVKTLIGESRIEHHEQRRPNLLLAAASPCLRVRPSTIEIPDWDLNIKVNPSVVPAPPCFPGVQIWGAFGGELGAATGAQTGSPR